MKIPAELESVGPDDFREVVNNLVCVVELTQSILGKAKVVVIEHEGWNPFQRWIDGSDASIKVSARTGRSLEAQRSQRNAGAANWNSPEVTVPQIHQANIVDSGVIDGRG